MKKKVLWIAGIVIIIFTLLNLERISYAKCYPCTYSSHSSCTNMSGWKSNGTSHYKECCCALQYNLGTHTGGTATCETKKVCTTCQLSYGNYGDHNYKDTYTPSGSGHIYQRKCSVCGNVSSTSGGVLPHSNSPTCTESATCSQCKEVQPALGHNSEIVYQSGYVAGQCYRYECQRSGCTYKGNWVGHDMSNSITTQPTCTKEGVRTYQCSRKSGHKYTESVPKTDHTYVNNGNCNGKKCSVCGDTTGTTTHSWGSWTYSDANQHKRTCSNSGCRTGTEYGNHSYSEWETTSTSTCEEKGTRKRSCSTCGHVETERLALVSHSYTEKMKSAATCTAAAVYYEECIWCKTQTPTYSKGDKLGHNFTGSFSYYNDSQHRRICTRCYNAYENKDHSGGTAHCMAPATCTTCNSGYGAIDSNNHDYTKPCPTCGSSNVICSRNDSHEKTHTCDITGPTVTASDITYPANATIKLKDTQSGIRYWAVTKNTTTPSSTASTNTTSGNTLAYWYPIANTTSEVSVTFTGLNAGTYYAWGKDLAGNTNRVQFKVNKKTGSVTATISGTTTVGQTLKVTYETESDGKVTYQWWRGNSSTVISGATSSTYKLVEADASAYIGVTVKVAEGTNHTACEDSDTKTIAFIKDIEPLITTNPSSIAVKEGEKATFSVVATGSNLKYQWQQSINSGSTWTDITNATSTSYTTGATTAGMNGYQYRCVVSNNAKSINSGVATLTVYYPPKVATHPSNQTVTYPAKATFTVTATNGNPSTTTYQWQYRTSSSGTWTNVTTTQGTGGTTTSFTTVATKVSMTGYQYRCVLSNEQYKSYVASNLATLTVNKAIIDVPSSPADKTYNGNSQSHGITIPANVSVVDGSITSAINAGTYNVVLKLNDSENYKWNDNSNTNKTITWKINRKPISAPVAENKIYNATKQTGLASGTGYTRNGTYEATNVGKYEAIAKLDSNYIWNDNTITDKTYTWTILDNAIGAITGPTAVQKKENETATFKVTETQGTNKKYQWYYNTTNNTTSGTKINNATSPEYSVVVDRSMNNRYYYCVISNNSESVTSLTSKTSGTALLTVWWSHEISVHPLDVNVKKDETATFSVKATGGNPSSYTYQWYSVPTATGGTPTKIDGAVNDTYSYKPTENISGIWYYCEVSNGQYMLTSNRAKLVADITTPKINNGNASKNYANKEVTFTVPITVTDTGEGFDVASFEPSDIVVKVNGITVSPTVKNLKYERTSGDDYIYTLELKGVTGDGALALEVNENTIKDDFGNMNSVTYLPVNNIVIDNTAPVIQLAGEVTGTNDGFINSEDEIQIPIKIIDVGGINPSVFTPSDIIVKIDGVVASDAKVEKVDYNGNSGNEYSYTVTINGITGNGELSLEIVEKGIEDLATNTNITTPITGLGVIIDNIKPQVINIVLALGSYNNSSRLYPESLSVDNDSWINESIYAVVNATDESSGVESYWHSIDDTTNFVKIAADREIWSDEMNNKVYYRVIDKAGNISEAKEVLMKIEKTAPIAAELDMRLSRENGLLYEYEATNPTSKSIYIIPKETIDTGIYQSGVWKTEYKITFNNGVTTTTSELIDGKTGTLLKETGTYIIEVITTDRAGNVSAPTKFFNAVIAKETENTVKISNIYDEGSGVQKLTIFARKQGASEDAIEPIVIENPPANINQRIPLSDGTYVIRVEIIDKVGLVKELSQTITNEL